VGNSDDAELLYHDRLSTPLFEGLGGFATIVELLSPLFTHGFDRPPALLTIRAQSYATNELALALRYLGDHAQAQRLYAVVIRIDLQERDARNLGTDLENLSDGLQDVGQLATAERAFQLSLALTQEAHEQERIDAVYQYLIGQYAVTGAWAQGETAYAALQASPEQFVKTSAFPFIHTARLRWGQGQDPGPMLGEALRLARDNRFLLAEREAQRLAGEVAFFRGDLPQAHEAWHATYTIAQRQGVPLGPYLADLARLHAAQQEDGQARALLTEALALGGHGVALAAVEVHVAFGEPAEAKLYVDTAYREAWANGPPYAFHFELQRIRAALKACGLLEPQLPPFDPARVPPVPDEAEIRVFIAELQREQGKGTAPAEKIGKHPWWKFWSQN
jgi:tetratricopeptide (TPR) repeat protein